MPVTVKQKIAKHVEDNLSIYIFIIVLFLMGIVFGAIIVNSLPQQTKANLLTYLQRFFGQVSEGQLADRGAMLGESFKNYLQYLGLIWLLGLSMIGLPIIFILLFLKGIVVGFTVGFLVNRMGLHGFIIAMASVFPQNLLMIPIFIIASAASVAFSLKMIRQLLIRTRKNPLLPQFLNYVGLFGMIVAAIFLAACFEAYVSPILMQGVVGKP
ncbi:stage II sporulation protein M [Tuberibacillus calidus]|jgi:stage II sporulation protein M|uniref:stage II sporulation protein M n=1 Tax=Tuberibacillus calidus TaxID=340097 RepID=UPI00042A4626|nr:stage II sporulation protein M [Tuberibacillus calidus]